jgi:hypothetical protein
MRSTSRWLGLTWDDRRQHFGLSVPRDDPDLDRLRQWTLDLMHFWLEPKDAVG